MVYSPKGIILGLEMGKVKTRAVIWLTQDNTRSVAELGKGTQVCLVKLLDLWSKH